MKKFFNYTGIAFLAVLAVTALWVINLLIQPYDNIRIYWSLGAEPEVLITDDFTYRDLNKNQQLDIYEDVRQPAAMRVEDLLSQMTLEEKAGQMMHPAITIKPDLALLAFHFAMGSVDIDAAEVFDKHISHFNFYGKPTPLEIAEKLN